MLYKALRLQSLARFSALQRAENSSMELYCRQIPIKRSFSALQRAENSSIEAVALVEAWQRGVSVLFSEPKIPQ